MGLNAIYANVTVIWFILETIYIIQKLWFKKIKEKYGEGKVIQILPNTYYRRGIYADIIVEYKGKKVKAHCSGWYPQIGENVVVIVPYLFVTDDTTYSCYAERETENLKPFLIASRIFMVTLWLGYFIWIYNPDFLIKIMRFLTR